MKNSDKPSLDDEAKGKEKKTLQQHVQISHQTIPTQPIETCQVVSKTKETAPETKSKAMSLQDGQGGVEKGKVYTANGCA